MGDEICLAETLYADGKIEDAKRCLLGLLDNDPENADALNNLGVIYYTQKKVERAETCLLQAYAVNNENLDTLLNLADLYRNSRRWEKASLQLERYISIDKQNSDVFNRLATVYLEMDKIEEAKQAMKHSLEIIPEQQIVKESLKLLETEIARSNPPPINDTEPRSQKHDPNNDINRANQRITSWDYKKFRHQPYPAVIGLDTFRTTTIRPVRINKHTRITSMGSCFARNIAVYLRSRQYNYLLAEKPFQQASAHWDQVFNTACMRQVFEYTFKNDWRPLIRWWHKGELVQDPFRRNILYKQATCEQEFASHREKSYAVLSQAEIIILTLGLIETWRDTRDKMTYYRVPAPQIYDPKVHEFYLQKVTDCQSDLDEIHILLKRHNPNSHIIVTVSPVPLFATFREDVDAVTANSLSKSTLRVAAEYFSRSHDNVTYFPAYEIVNQAIQNSYQDDNRHVTPGAINQVMGVFESEFMA